MKLTRYKRLGKKGSNPVWSYVYGTWSQVSLLSSSQSLFSAVYYKLLTELAGKGSQDCPEKVSFCLLINC